MGAYEVVAFLEGECGCNVMGDGVLERDGLEVDVRADGRMIELIVRRYDVWDGIDTMHAARAVMIEPDERLVGMLFGKCVDAVEET